MFNEGSSPSLGLYKAVEPAASHAEDGCSCKLAGIKGARFSLIYYFESFHSITFRIIMPFRNFSHRNRSACLVELVLARRKSTETPKGKSTIAYSITRVYT